MALRRVVNVPRASYFLVCTVKLQKHFKTLKTNSVYNKEYLRLVSWLDSSWEVFAYYFGLFNKQQMSKKEVQIESGRTFSSKFFWENDKAKCDLEFNEE